jgi:phosphate transport system substrate-binding protein
VKMSKKATRAGILVAAVLGSCAYSAAALAGEVTLRAKNGDFQIRGELVSYDNNKYTIMSASLGSMSLDASRFDCIGGGCPTDAIAMRAEPPPDVPAGPLSISISGSNTIGNQLMPNLIEAYAEATKTKLTKVVSADALDVEFRVAGQDGHDGGVIALHRHGSATAFTDLEKKVAQIGMASRPVKAEEAQKIITAGLGDVRRTGSEHILGLDGLLVLVSPQNPVISLPTDTIAKIFSGQITDWAQVGQPAGTINVYAPTKESGTFDTFDNLVLKPNKLELTPTAKRTPNHAEQSDWVAHDVMGHRLRRHCLPAKRQSAQRCLKLWPHRTAIYVQHQDRGVSALEATVSIHERRAARSRRSRHSGVRSFSSGATDRQAVRFY